jgi:hypothetical protein
MDIKERFNRLNRLSKTVGPYDDLRSALVWPSGAQPGYFLVLLVKHNTSEGKPWLRFLYEVKVEDGLQELFDEVLPVAEEFRLKEILTHLDGSQESWDLMHVFDERKRYSSRGVTAWLRPAPFSSDFTGTGFTLVRRWANRLDVPDPDTVLRKQLGEISEEHLESPSDMNRLYALKALAYIAGDLEKNPKARTPDGNPPQSSGGGIGGVRPGIGARKGIV